MIRKIDAYFFFFFFLVWLHHAQEHSSAALPCPRWHSFHPGGSWLPSTATKARTQGILSTRPALPVWHPGKEQTVGLEGTVTHSRPVGFQLGNPHVILKASLSSVLDPKPPHCGPQRFKLGEELSLAQNKSSSNISALFSRQDFL